MNRFEGKVVLVTGGASGIGAASVRRLLADGAIVVAADVSQDSVDKLAAEFDGNERLQAVRVDVTDRAQVETFVSDAAKRFGALHGLLHSAGIRGVGNILDTDPADWKKVLAVNLDGAFNVCQLFARAARASNTRGVSIVNVSSAAGIRGVPNRLPYAASKHGVVGLTTTMALELGPLGIRVNALIPGMIRTPLTASMFEDPENVKRISAAHPIGRFGEAEEVAAAAAFLLSDDASFITGVALVVDGGKTAGIASH